MKLVISLGGSVIVPDGIDCEYLKRFKRIINNISNGNKVVIVTGGGSTARKYIAPLNSEGLNEKTLSFIGYNATRLNALFVKSFFKFNFKVPESLKEIKELLKKHNVVVTGALDFKPHMTSDGTSADVARFIKADCFINVTNVKGLYDKNPRKFKNAKFIPRISFREFLKMTNKVRFKPGQHFALDSVAARTISRYRIKTYIIKGPENIKKIVKGEKFVGTVIN